MAKQFVVRGYYAIAQADNFENGCHGPSKDYGLTGSEWVMCHTSLDGLIKDLCAEFKADPDCVLLNSCDEMGRLDIQVMQREVFTPAKVSAASMERFKAGEIDLWLTDYTFHVEIVEDAFDLTAHVADKSIYAAS